VNFQEKLPQLEDSMNIHAQIITAFHRKTLNKDQQWQEDQFSTDHLSNLQGQQWIARVQTETPILKVTAILEIH
jgi:predicted SPOUT superfamily RNA methylase MTH1